MDPGSTTGQGRDWRERIRNSRLATVLVLGLTAALVMAGSYLINHPTAPTSGFRAVTLTGAKDGLPPKIGRLAQDFAATTVDGKPVSLSSLRGHPIWLTFGASWCAACQAEAPDIESAYQKNRDQGLIVLAIFISESAAAVQDYGDRVGLTFLKVADPDTRIASAYRVYGIPSHFFIDRKGVVRLMKIGSLSPERMAASIAVISR